jgi:hypothetical protein
LPSRFDFEWFVAADLPPPTTGMLMSDARQYYTHTRLAISLFARYKSDRANVVTLL